MASTEQEREDTWYTQEEFEADLVNYAAYFPAQFRPNFAPVPDTILKHRKRMAANQRQTLNGEIDEDITYVVSGRGRGITDRTIKPGGVLQYHPQDDVLLREQIREASGLGYSNDLIESSIKANAYEPRGEGDHKLISSSSSRDASPNTNKVGFKKAKKPEKAQTSSSTSS